MFDRERPRMEACRFGGRGIDRVSPEPARPLRAVRGRLANPATGFAVEGTQASKHGRGARSIGPPRDGCPGCLGGPRRRGRWLVLWGRTCDAKTLRSGARVASGLSHTSVPCGVLSATGRSRDRPSRNRGALKGGEEDSLRSFANVVSAACRNPSLPSKSAPHHGSVHHPANGTLEGPRPRGRSVEYSARLGSSRAIGPPTEGYMADVRGYASPREFCDGSLVYRTPSGFKVSSPRR
jgi:hypothetical protein